MGLKASWNGYPVAEETNLISLDTWEFLVALITLISFSLLRPYLLTIFIYKNNVGGCSRRNLWKFAISSPFLMAVPPTQENICKDAYERLVESSLLPGKRSPQ